MRVASNRVTVNCQLLTYDVAVQEVLQRNPRRQGEDPSVAQRRASVMFDLSIQLARLLEFLAAQLPTAFSRGSSLNMSRLMELQSFILTHTAGQGAAACSPVALCLPMCHNTLRVVLWFGLLHVSVCAGACVLVHACCQHSRSFSLSVSYRQ